MGSKKIYANIPIYNKMLEDSSTLSKLCRKTDSSPHAYYQPTLNEYHEQSSSCRGAVN